jgi:TonB-dependent SusC/RagA subfamily outer membrane receptor
MDRLHAEVTMTRRTLFVLAGVTLGAGCAKHGQSPATRPNDSVEVGYGAQPRGKNTGASTTLSGDDMSRARPMRIDELLRGKVAGLDIIQNGNTVVFRIRGGVSLDTTNGGRSAASMEPLVIVDDMQIQQGNIMNALAGLTPDDIKQVTVLKDLASTSIYGGRGAGGVILITTKNKHEDR